MNHGLDTERWWMWLWMWFIHSFRFVSFDPEGRELGKLGNLLLSWVWYAWYGITGMRWCMWPVGIWWTCDLGWVACLFVCLAVGCWVMVYRMFAIFWSLLLDFFCCHSDTCDGFNKSYRVYFINETELNAINCLFHTHHAYLRIPTPIPDTNISHPDLTRSSSGRPHCHACIPSIMHRRPQH